MKNTLRSGFMDVMVFNISINIKLQGLPSKESAKALIRSINIVLKMEVFSVLHKRH